MARARHRSKQNSKAKRARSQAPAFKFPRTSVSADVDAKIERARRRRDAERAESKRKREAPQMQRVKRVASKTLLKDFRAHGYPVNTTGVYVDGPRDSRRRPLKGVRMELHRGGVVKTSVGSRRDFVYGFTKREKKEFAKNPEAFTAFKLRELEQKYPTLKNRRNRQVRLQWGAYQHTKDFAPTQFDTDYFKSYFEYIKGKPRTKKIDALTGLHIVVHVPKSSNADKQKRGAKKRAKKTQGRKRR